MASPVAELLREATAPVKLTHPAFDAARRQVFVIGNEAADVDSLVSAYTVAQLLDSVEVEGVALAQITRAEFRLRGDGLKLFKEAGSELATDGSPVRLRFWDEVDWDAVRGLGTRRLVLADHNKMTPKVAACFEADQVQTILDHHADQHLYPDARRNLDETLGSACTLVNEEFATTGREVTSEIGQLLLGVILLDSRNFDKVESKGTERDAKSVEQLGKFLPQAGREEWYRQLSEARRDVSHLSARENLMVDFKVAPVGGFEGSVAFCALFPTLDSIISMAGGPAEMIKVMQDFAREQGVKAVVCNSAKDETGMKGLAAVPATAAEEVLVEAIISRVAGAPGNLPQELLENGLYDKQGILTQGFGLQPRPEVAPLRAFKMRNEISRKTMLPRAVSEAGAAKASM